MCALNMRRTAFGLQLVKQLVKEVSKLAWHAVRVHPCSMYGA